MNKKGSQEIYLSCLSCRRRTGGYLDSAQLSVSLQLSTKVCNERTEQLIIEWCPSRPVRISAIVSHIRLAVLIGPTCEWWVLVYIIKIKKMSYIYIYVDVCLSPLWYLVTYVILCLWRLVGWLNLPKTLFPLISTWRNGQGSVPLTSFSRRIM